MLLGQILINEHNVKPEDIEKALAFQERFGGLLGGILINMGIISEEILVLALSKQLNLVRAAEIEAEEFDLSGLSGHDGLNLDFLVARQWIPVGLKNESLFFAAVNPLEHDAVQYLQDFDFNWEVFISTESRLRELETRYAIKKSEDEIETFDFSDMMETEIDRLKELATEAPVVNLVNSLISRAVLKGASDLHFEPHKNMYRVRFRIDGKLYDIDFLPLKMQLPVASRIKILSGMDIAERRRPQDGQITTRVASKEVDIRVSTLPLVEGESLVLRFLVKEAVTYDLDNLGFEKDLSEQLLKDIQKNAGVILLTGPTGSGKTTTLYSCLNQINQEDLKLITIEDPVEYQLEGINQININPEIGYDFLSALRSILRQDPDVLMVGEIRDGETARVAMQSSLTGHLVFSTVHTNDAPTAYTRLLDLGVAEYLINSSLISVIAQRLIRRVCPECAEPYVPDSAEVETYGLDRIAGNAGLKEITLMRAMGCPSCNHTGYRGRVAILEYLSCDDHIKALPKDENFLQLAKKHMAASQIRSLMEDGLLKVARGISTIERGEPGLRVVKNFNYKAYDTSGAEKKGQIQGKDIEGVKARLKQAGLIPVKISEVEPAVSDLGRFFKIEFAPGIKEIEELTSRLSLLLKARIKIDKALAASLKGIKNSQLEKAMTEVLGQVRSGVKLSDAMAKYPRIFDSLYVSMVRVGEGTGDLAGIFEDITASLGFHKDILSKTKQALIYPAVIFFVCVGAILFIFNFIVPRFSVVFADTPELPFYTQMLLAASDFVTRYQLVIFPALVISGFMLYSFRDHASVKKTKFYLAAKLPLVKGLNLTLENLRFVSSLSMLLSSGVVLSDALGYAVNSVSNPLVRKRLGPVKTGVRQGERLSEVLGKTGFLPEIFNGLIEIGEQTGNLSEIFRDMEIRLKESYEKAMAAMITLIEPVMIIIMAAVVGTIVVGLLLSMVSVNDMVFKEDGFTLIELMVVMVIMGALLALVGPPVFKGIDRTRISVEEKELGAIIETVKMTAFARKTPLTIKLEADTLYVLDQEENPADQAHFGHLFFEADEIRFNGNGFPDKKKIRYMSQRGKGELVIDE